MLNTQGFPPDPVDLHFIARPRYKETAGVACGPVDVAGGRDAATLGLWRH